MGARLRTIWLLLRGALAEARERDVFLVARALAYSLFLALPAVLLVLLGLLAVFGGERVVEELVSRADSVLPAEATVLLEDSLRRTTEAARGGAAMLTLGAALGVWTASSAATTLMAGMTAAFGREETRGFVRRRLVALAIVAVLGLGAALVLGLLVLGPHLERWLGRATGAEAWTAWVWWTAQWPILVLALLSAFATIMRLAPDAPGRSWRLAGPGAVTALVVWLAASAGFSAYAARFGSYEKTWGALSAVIVTLVWLWLTSAALLFGAVVEARARRAEEERASSRRRAPEPPFRLQTDRVPRSG